jgi:hypothetical protein
MILTLCPEVNGKSSQRLSGNLKRKLEAGGAEAI